MHSADLIETARAITETGRGRPNQARLRRAVSTAYYAMFHTLAASAADLFIGQRRDPAWHRTYRALEHGRAKHACRQAQRLQEFPSDIRDFAEVFVAMQVERQKADYALDTRAYRKSDVRGYIVAAETAIRCFARADLTDRRSFAAHVLFRQRPS